jgi:hypothetical protein
MDHFTLILHPTLGDVRRDQDGNFWTTFQLVGGDENVVICAICGSRISSGYVQALADRWICFKHAVVVPLEVAWVEHP